MKVHTRLIQDIDTHIGDELRRSARWELVCVDELHKLAAAANEYPDDRRGMRHTVFRHATDGTSMHSTASAAASTCLHSTLLRMLKMDLSHGASDVVCLWCSVVRCECAPMHSDAWPHLMARDAHVGQRARFKQRSEIGEH